MVYGTGGGVYGTGAGVYGTLTAGSSSNPGVALGVGAGGAFVDVTSYITGPEGITYSFGQTNQFMDPNPGVVSFVLDNYDGRFTPNNPASPYPSPVTEGTKVAWITGTRLWGGVITGIAFATTEDQWGRITITCGDVFQIANRTAFDDFAAAVGSTGAFYWWPFNDPAGSLTAAGSPGPSLGPYLALPTTDPVTVTFGVASAAPTADTQTTFTYGAVTNTMTGSVLSPVVFPAGSYGCWGFWVTPLTPNFMVDVAGWVAGYGSTPFDIVVYQQGTGVFVQASVPFTGVPFIRVPVPWVIGVAHHVAAAITYVGTSFTLTLYIDGVVAATSTGTATGVTAASMQPTEVRITPGDGSNPGAFGLQHLYFAPAYHNEAAAGVTTESSRFAALMSLVPSAVIGTVDPNLSTAPVGVMSTGKSNVWTNLCSLNRTEQGYLYTTTSGTLLAPSTVVNFRARTRPSSVALSFDVSQDLEGLPQFARDITNLYGEIDATGPSNSATFVDPAAVARVGSAATSDTVVSRDYADLYGYASDRMMRAENLALNVAQFTVNTKTATNVTAAQIMGLTVGDRIRLTNIPAGPLGFTSWDGWFIGCQETHNLTGDTFIIYTAPCLTGTGIYDTDVFGAGGELSLSTSMTAAQTTMSVTSADGLTTLATSGFPYTLQVDSEQVTVTGCTSATPQVATITRAVNGTTAATHAAATTVDDATVPVFAF